MPVKLPWALQEQAVGAARGAKLRREGCDSGGAVNARCKSPGRKNDILDWGIGIVYKNSSGHCMQRRSQLNVGIPQQETSSAES